MKLYLNNLIPRIIEFSESLDKKEILVDVPWVFIDHLMVQHKYIFKRNGELIVSANGQASTGKWEFLSAANSLFIDRGTDKILLNHSFVDSAVMVLKKDGSTDDLMIFANQLVLPELNAMNYLKKLYYNLNQTAVRELKSGELLELDDYKGWIHKNRVSIEGEPVPDGIMQLAKSGKKLMIVNSAIYKVIINQRYETDKGIITIEEEERLGPAVGNKVFQNGSIAPNGKYRLAFMNHIVIRDGVIFRKDIF